MWVDRGEGLPRAALLMGTAEPMGSAAIEQAALDPVGAQPALDGLTLVALRGIG